ncbi:MAG: hypothetical protein CMM58_03380 [Rhodospirillaceae bacterium]|nr:hypothetical protein [Rhodospirillaceae bacterium]|tara:strand:- start:1980 stop:2741 length:762 start_codon:yes stop_codon:yes gene_type:complete
MIFHKPFYIFFLIIFSPFVGSYLATILVRLNANLDILRPHRSKCTNCQQKLRVFDAVPILSFVVLGGYCRYCKSPINPIYFVSEVACLIAAVTAGGFLSEAVFEEIFISLSLAWALIGLSIFDVQNKRIPDSVTIPLIFTGIAQSYFLETIDVLDSFLGLIAGGLISSLVAVIYKHFRRKTGLGWGDIKLIAAFGAWLGWQLLPLFVLISSTTALIFLLLGLILRKTNASAIELPFGPFLCATGWCLWLHLLD